MKRPLSLALFVTLSLLQLAHAQPAKISIVDPGPGQQIAGNVEIRVTAEGKSAPKRICVGIGKVNWQEMEQVESTGEWVGTIDTTQVPNGDQLLRVITENKKVGAAVTVNIKNPLKVFFSDLHSHTSYSDGVLIPSVAHEYARDVFKLNIFCLTDHLESVDDAEWIDMRETAWDANQDGHFIAFPGLEWTNNGDTSTSTIRRHDIGQTIRQSSTRHVPMPKLWRSSITRAVEPSHMAV